MQPRCRSSGLGAASHCPENLQGSCLLGPQVGRKLAARWQDHNPGSSACSCWKASEGPLSSTRAGDTGSFLVPSAATVKNHSSLPTVRGQGEGDRMILPGPVITEDCLVGIPSSEPVQQLPACPSQCQRVAENQLRGDLGPDRPESWSNLGNHSELDVLGEKIHTG